MSNTNINTISRKLALLASAERKIDKLIRTLTRPDDEWVSIMLRPVRVPVRSFVERPDHFHISGGSR